MITRASHKLLNCSNERLNSNITSMHSSRMRTAHLLTIPRSIRGGGWCPPGGCLPGGCLPGGVCLRGCLPSGGVCPIACWDTPPVNRVTDRCKNITLSQTSFTGGTNIYCMYICNSTYFPFPILKY